MVVTPCLITLLKKKLDRDAHYHNDDDDDEEDADKKRPQKKKTQSSLKRPNRLHLPVRRRSLLHKPW